MDVATDFPDRTDLSIPRQLETTSESYRNIPISQFYSLQITPGDIYGFALDNFFVAGIFQFNADGSVTDLSGQYSGLTWAQQQGSFLVKQGDDFTVKIQYNIKDKSLTPIFSSTVSTSDREVFMTVLGVQIKDDLGSLPIEFASFAGKYQSETFGSDLTYTFNTDRSFVMDLAADTDLAFLWKVEEGNAKATAYYTQDWSSRYSALSDLLSCENQTLSCNQQSRTYQVIRKDAGSGQIVYFRKLFNGSGGVTGTFIDSFYRVL